MMLSACSTARSPFSTAWLRSMPSHFRASIKTLLSPSGVLPSYPFCHIASSLWTCFRLVRHLVIAWVFPTSALPMLECIVDVPMLRLVFGEVIPELLRPIVLVGLLLIVILRVWDDDDDDDDDDVFFSLRALLRRSQMFSFMLSLSLSVPFRRISLIFLHSFCREARRPLF